MRNNRIPALICALALSVTAAETSYAAVGFDFRLERKGDQLTLDWDTGKYDDYDILVHRRVNDYPWRLIYSGSEKMQSALSVDYYEDRTPPSMPLIDRVDAEEMAVHFYSVDFGDTINYRVEALNGGEALYSLEKGMSNISGLKGYFYLIDQSEYTRVSEDDKFLWPDAPLFVPGDVSAGDYLHIAAADNKGNMSVTLHIDIFHALGLDKTVYDEITIIGQGYKNMEQDEILFRQTQYYEKDMEATITAPEVQGWSLVYEDDRNADALFGYDREVVFNYRPKMGVVTVRGTDANSGDIIYESKEACYIGDKYKAAPPDIAGYTLAEQLGEKELMIGESGDSIINFVYKKNPVSNHIIYVEKYLNTANGPIFIESGYHSGGNKDLLTVFANDTNGKSAFVSKLEDVPYLVYDYAELYDVDNYMTEITNEALIYARYGELSRIELYYKAVYETKAAAEVFINYIVNGKIVNVTEGSALVFKTEADGVIRLKCPDNYNGYALMDIYEYADSTDGVIKKRYEVENGILEFQTEKNSHMLNLVYGNSGVNSKLNIICIDENESYLLEPQVVEKAIGGEIQLTPFNIDFYSPYSCYVDGEFISDGSCNIIPKKNEHEVIFVYEKIKN